MTRCASRDLTVDRCCCGGDECHQDQDHRNELHDEGIDEKYLRGIYLRVYMKTSMD
jgi:hypothetical protein